MDFFSNLDLLSVGVIIAAIGILGFTVLFNNPKSATNRTFLGFCLLTIAWGTLNFLSYRIKVPEIGFWLLRLSIFTAVWHSWWLFKLLYIFPKEAATIPKTFSKIMFPAVYITAILNLTPFTFKQIAVITQDGRISQITNGPGIVLFSIVILTLVSSAIFVFLKKIKSGVEVTPKQVEPILAGIIATFALILLFNLVYPAFLNNSRYIPFGAFFMFPFIVGTSYSIFKHGFLNIKIISTEILTFVLALVVLLETILSVDLISTIFRSALFILVVTVGILLIKSVVREVKQREELQKLSTQLEAANEKLQALDKARAEFISIASHQLRTPPATIKWYTGALLSGDYGPLPDEIKTIIEKTSRTNNSLISLIEDLLNVSRIERGTMEFLFEQIKAEDLTELTFEQLLPIAQSKKLQLIYHKPTTPLPLIMADREKLRQVMNNMIDNSLKYTKQGIVEVSLFEDQGAVRFQVKDTGKGINSEEAKNIFEKFKRGRQSIGESAGLGLGLYVAKVIVEQHKGKMWAESEGEGKGSTFIFTIPIKNDLQATTLLDLTK